MAGSSIIYLDNNATTAVDPAVFAAMEPFFCELFGNASSTYRFGSQVHEHIERARTQLAQLLGVADTQQIIFTSCGSESDNAAVHIACGALPQRNRIVTTAVEHLAILDTCRAKRDEGYDVVEVGVDANGALDMDAFEQAVDDDICLVTMMWANNETGVVFPIEECARIAKKHGALFHTDAVQVVGKAAINLDAMPDVDMLSLSGHKLHAPKGIGALYVKAGTPYRKFLLGGHQERNRRAGTEASALIVGLGEAARLAHEHMDYEKDVVGAMRDRLEQGILASIDNVRVNGAEPRTPNTLSVAFSGVEEDFVLKMLDEHGICVSSGSACNSEVIDPSHVMLAMGVPKEFIGGVLRFSLSRFTTEEEIDQVLAILPEVIRQSRAMSLFTND